MRINQPRGEVDVPRVVRQPELSAFRDHLVRVRVPQPIEARGVFPFCLIHRPVDHGRMG